MENDKNLMSLVQHFEYLAYAFNEVGGASKAINRLFNSPNVKPILSRNVLLKMEKFFTEVVYVVYEINFLTVVNYRDADSLNNLSIEVDSLISLAKEIMADVKAIVYRDRLS